MNCLQPRTFASVLSVLALLVPLSGQDYYWPTEAGKNITATFGDVRPRRYHAGLDISTGGANGHPVNAIDDGYIERILVSTQGYGRAIYLRLKDRRVAVYAHLQRFVPDLNNLVWARQQQLGKYALDLRFKPTDHPVLKGDVIGFTGDTGSVSGPHLHFELRSSDNRPLNPLSHGLEVEDEGLPLIRSLAVIPLKPGASAHGSMLPSILRPREIKPGVYVLDDTIGVDGPVGLAIQAYDQVPGMRYYHTLYGASLSVDGRRHYAIQFDQYNFREGTLSQIERDYRLARLNDDDYHRLFISEANQNLSFIRPQSKGVLELEAGYHRFSIKVWDKEQNVAILRGVLAKTPPTTLSAGAEWSDDENGWIVTLDSSTPLRAYHVFFFTVRGLQQGSFSQTPSSNVAKTIRFVVPQQRGNQRILQIVAIDRWGVRLEPIHVSLIPAEEITQERVFTLLMDSGPNQMAIQISSDLYLPQAPEAVLVTKTGAYRYATSMVSPTAFLIPPLPMSRLVGLEKIIVRVPLEPPYEVHIPVYGVVVPPESRQQLTDPEGLLRLEFRPGTFYDSTFVSYKTVEVDPPDSGSYIIRPIQIGPATIPLRGPMGLQMKVPKNRMLVDHAGIFYLDDDDGWTFMEPAGEASRENLVKTRAYRTLATSGDIFALIEENEPPEIDVRNPGAGATYSSADFSTVRAIVRDHLAGIADEQAISMKLDNKEMLFEYNTHRDAVTYTLPRRLNPGDHQLILSAVDQLGNFAADTVNFVIR